MMRTETGSFEGRGGRIFQRAWLPEQRVRGAVVLVHGVAEHSGRYVHVGEWLADNGFAVFALDHPGHGRSAGRTANVGSIDAAADNVETALLGAARRFPDVSRFVVGHSMGSLIALHLATRAPLDVDGIAVSAPPLIIEAGNRMQRLLAPVLSRWTPNLGVLHMDSSLISRDPEVVRAYETDPLVFRGKIPARTAAEILRATETVVARLDRLTVATLVLQGTEDGIAAPASADLLPRYAGTDDLTVERYPGLYHELFNEPERDEVLSDLVGWLDEHLST